MNRILLTNGMRKYLLMAALMLAGVMTAQGQAVIMNGNYFLTHNEAGTTVNTAATNTFNPAKCLWNINTRYIRTADSDGNAFDGNNYLQASQNSVSLGGSSQWQQAADNQTLISARTGSWWYTYYYLRLNSTTWQIGTSNSNNGTAYAVDISSGTTTSTNPTISGSDVITATGNTTYTASGAAYQQGGYTNYRFNNADHFFNGNTAITPAGATISGYNWSISSNADVSASGTTNQGSITVNALPESDEPATITVTVTFTGGTPAAPANTTLTATKEIIIQGTKPSAPIISVSGNIVTLSTDAAGSTTIRYTLDGTDPTASTGTVYSGAIDLSGSSTSPVTIKAITVRNGNASEVTEQTVTLTLPAPTITINGEAKTATISSSVAGATIYYTTDGTTPTTSSSQYTGTLTGLAYMTNVKAIAVKDGWNNSPEASGIVTIPSGVSGDVVTLFDYEPHSWSYYSDPQCPIRSLNPADVKITYYGNGQTANNMTTSDVKDVPTSFGAKATGVQVSATETENTFVYYKTLERTNGEGAASKAAANGAAMYTTIPNPFQVRPTGQDNGNQSITPSSRTIVIVTNRTGNNSGFDNGSTLSVSWGGSIRAIINSRTTTTILAPVGEIVTLTYTANSTNNIDNRSTVTVYYDANGGTQIFAQYTPNTNRTRTFTVAAPASQTVACGTYRGFYAWRVKSKSASITSITDVDGNTFSNDIIPAETDIRINTSSEYGNEIEFEALWAQAYATTGSTDLSYAVSSSTPSAYERNFHILNASTAATNFQKGYPCTVIGRAPNSTTLNATRAVTGAFTAASDTKFEELNITGATGSTWTAAGHDLIIGRGCSGTINYVRGVSGNTTAPNYTLRIESGTINYLSLLKGYWTGSNDYTDDGSTMSGNVDLRCVLGCDYDRATNEGVTNNLIINNNVILGAANTIADANKHRETTNLIVKSGKIGNSININSNNSYMADAYQSIYMSVSNSQQTIGQRKVLVEGGEIIGIAGGIDAHYLGTGVTNNNVTGIPTPHTEEPSFSVRMIGGKVRGCIYGGAAKSPASGNRRMVFTGGTINGWIGCGCNGTEDDGGKTYGESFLYFGGETRCEADPSHDFTMNGTKGGYVFGAGKGFAGGTGTSGEMTYGTNVAIADNSYVQRDVFGGGNYGYALESTNVYVCGGTVHGNAFGGSNLKNGPVVNIKMIGGLIEGGLYGGSNETGNISGNVTVQIDGGQVGTPSQNANVHGGGYGEATRVNGNVTLNIGNCNNGTATIYGDVYGGSAMGTVNDASSDNTTVSLYKGTIYGGLYGGGYGPGGEAANVNGAVQVNVFGGSVLCSASDPDGVAGTGSVFGCNNISGAPQSTVKVDIYNTDQPASGYALHAVYGGGNKSPYNNTPVVTIHGCSNSIEYVYGGGNATDVRGTNVTIWGGTIGNAFAGGNGAGAGNPGANITLNGTKLYIHGGEIGAAFGGSNERGTINGGIRVDVDYQPETATPPTCVAAYTQCPMLIGELYGGGNKAPIVTSTDGWIIPVVTIACEAKIGMLFGGAKAADYGGDINLVVDGGTFEKVFGGNNQGGTIGGSVNVTFNGGSAKEVYGGCNESGTINGSITVNIDSTNTTCTPRFYVENVYGGGNLAKYTGNPAVNIKNGTVQQNVYGGGFGSTAIVTGTPVVTVGVSDAGKTARVWGHVFGGGNAAAITGSTNVNILYDSYVKGHVFGGGNAAAVSTDTFVLVRDKAKVFGNIYGGGNQGEIGGNTKVIVNGN